MRSWFPLALSLCGFLLLAGASAAPQGPPRDLVPGRPVDGELSGGQSQSYRFSATRGQFIRIVVQRRGLRPIVELLRPDGTSLIAVGYMVENFQAETVVVMADASGVFTLKVTSVVAGSPTGGYGVRLEELRDAVPLDQTRVDAERSFERARHLSGTLRQADFPQALDAFTTAVAGYRAAGDRPGELKAVLERGWAEYFQGRSEAMTSAMDAEQFARETGDEASRARALRLRSNVLARAGDIDAALRANGEAIAIYQRIGDRDGEGLALNDEGINLGRTGDSDRAIARFERGLTLAREVNDRESIQQLLNNMGIAYKNLGELDKAVDAYRQVLADPAIQRVPALQGTALNNLGNVQRLLGNYREALATQEQALAIARTIGNKEVEARSLNTIGQAYFALGENATALTSQQESLALRRTLGDRSAESASLDSVGRTLERLGQLDAAEASLSESLNIRREIREQYSEPSTLRTLAMVDRDRGHLSLALEHITAAVDLDEALRARITSPELRATFVASELDKYELYIDLLQQQDAADPSKGHAAAAFEVSERARARVLLESLLDARVDLRQGIEPALLERERALQKQLNTASAQLSRALAAPGAKAPPADLARNYERLTGEYRQHLALIRQQSPHYAAVTQPQPLAAAEIQRGVIDDNTVLLEFEIGEDRSWLWALTPRSLTSVALPPRAEIDAAARAFHEDLTARQRRPEESGPAYAQRVAAADARLGAHAAAVSRLLFSGIAGHLHGDWRNKRLAIVAAGSLEYLPFAALPPPGGGTRGRLASSHEIVRIPSASVLAVLRSEAAGRTRASKALAIVADPVFETTDPRVAAAAHAPAPAGTAGAGRAGDIDESLYLRSGLSRLPFSRDEANGIAALAGTNGVLEAVDFAANRTAVLGGALGGYRIVHFATHGVLDSARPSLSGLVLSLVDEQGRHQDGFIRLHDIYNMRLNADLVVLSACQTALGKDIKGEGLIGLTRAFMYAGTPRVVASLWEVNDLATAELMKAFYAGMLQKKLPPAAALRAAQLEMMKNPRWASPYYWAGFVFQGDWK